VLGFAPDDGRAGRLRRKLAGAIGGNLQMVDILAAVLSDGLPAVEAACAEALSENVHSAGVILNILSRRREPAAPIMILTPEALRLRHELDRRGDLRQGQRVAAGEDVLPEPGPSARQSATDHLCRRADRALDSERAGIVMDLLRELVVEQQAAIITVTHDEKIIGRLDRILRLRDGRLEDDRDSARAWGVGRRASENAARYAHFPPR
jgi:hypothetical protein